MHKVVGFECRLLVNIFVEAGSSQIIENSWKWNVYVNFSRFGSERGENFFPYETILQIVMFKLTAKELSSFSSGCSKKENFFCCLCEIGETLGEMGFCGVESNVRLLMWDEVIKW